MAALSQLAVHVGDNVVCVEKLPDQMSLEQYIKYNCEVSERDVSDVLEYIYICYQLLSFVNDLFRMIVILSLWWTLAECCTCMQYGRRPCPTSSLSML